MKAVVLAAGLGTRLRPLTDTWPKPAVPLLGQPLLRYALAVLARAGVTDLGLNTHHLPALMARVAEAEAARVGMALTLSHEPSIQGTAGGIRGLRRVVEGADTFVVWNGDALFTPDLAPLIAEHRAGNAVATLVLLPMPPGESFATVEVDGAGRVQRIAGRGPGGAGLVPWHFSGVHILSPRVLDAMAKEGPEDINRDVYPRLIAAGEQVRGAVVRTAWSDVGTPARYLAAQRALLSGEVPDVFGGGSPFARATPGEVVWRVSSAVLEGTAHGPVFLDAGAVVESGAAVGPNVYVGPGVRVRAGSNIAHTALLGGEVPVARTDHAILWAGNRLQAEG
jgi:mannose-1-phosphate guanylyltransferase